MPIRLFSFFWKGKVSYSELRHTLIVILEILCLLEIYPIETN